MADFWHQLTFKRTGGLILYHYWNWECLWVTECRNSSSLFKIRKHVFLGQKYCPQCINLETLPCVRLICFLQDLKKKELKKDLFQTKTLLAKVASPSGKMRHSFTRSGRKFKFNDHLYFSLISLVTTAGNRGVTTTYCSSWDTAKLVPLGNSWLPVYPLKKKKVLNLVMWLYVWRKSKLNLKSTVWRK